MPQGDRPAVLVVEDERELLSLYGEMLEPDYEVYPAESGGRALEVMGDHVDLCLIDRRMPGMAGREVVQALRDQGYDQPIAMVTAVKPDFDVLEMGFDDYIVKPVSMDDLRSLVKSLLLRREYDDVMREYFALASKVAVLRAEKTAEDLAEHQEYRDTVDRLNRVKREAKHSLESAADAGRLEELMWGTYLQGQAAEELSD